jgi:hypothetical protein
MKTKNLYFLLAFFLITLFCGLVYASTQQSLRLSADDPQTQIVRDVLGSLNEGAEPAQLSLTASDMANTLSSFVIIYDNKEKVAGSTVQLDKKVPTPPSGAFEKVKNNNESRFTWEPKKGVRNAVVMIKYKDGYILAGRSLREIEKREKIVLLYSLAAWVLGVGATTLVYLFSKSKANTQEIVNESPAPKRKPRAKRK